MYRITENTVQYQSSSIIFNQYWLNLSKIAEILLTIIILKIVFTFYHLSSSSKRQTINTYLYTL